MKPFVTNKTFIIYLIKFIGVFCIAYFGTLAIIGLSAPGGRYYAAVIDHHLNYVNWIRSAIMHASKWLLSLFGLDTYTAGRYELKLKHGRGIRMVYSCVGYGIMSFWLAFVVANNGSFTKKMLWISSGLVSIWVINVIRISLLLVSVNRSWKMPLGFNHHTWFNIASYLLIFALIYFYDRSGKVPGAHLIAKTPALRHIP